MSACDTCVRPGACCRALPLPSIPTSITVLEFMVRMAAYDHSSNWGIGLPFVNPRVVRLDAVGADSWVVDCLWLREDGRCGEYETRPHGPCRLYQPGADPLCAHYIPRIGLCPELTQPPEIHVRYKLQLQGVTTHADVRPKEEDGDQRPPIHQHPASDEGLPRDVGGGEAPQDQSG